MFPADNYSYSEFHSTRGATTNRKKSSSSRICPNLSLHAWPLSMSCNCTSLSRRPLNCSPPLHLVVFAPFISHLKHSAVKGSLRKHLCERTVHYFARMWALNQPAQCQSTFIGLLKSIRLDSTHLVFVVILSSSASLCIYSLLFCFWELYSALCSTESLALLDKWSLIADHWSNLDLRMHLLLFIHFTVHLSISLQFPCKTISRSSLMRLSIFPANVDLNYLVSFRNGSRVIFMICDLRSPLFIRL